MQFLTALSLFAFTTLFNSASAQECTSIEVRKEWRNLTTTEQKAWVDAVNCLNTVPRKGNLNPPLNTAVAYPAIYNQIAPVTVNSTYYDDLVYAHMDLNPIIHFTGLFFPWHRLYVHQWTNALRTECGYTGVAPYWAWEKDAADFENSPMWDTQLGGFGDPNDDYTVKSGGLNITLAYPITHKLRREYRPYPGFGGSSNVSANSTFNQQQVDNLLAQPEGNFTAFQEYMEKIVGMHSAIHGILGGDLAGLCPAGSSNTSVCPTEGAPTFSANEPMFHMHHGNVDRLWWLWQEKSETNKAAFHGGSVQNMSALDTYPNGQAPWLNKTSPIPTAACTSIEVRKEWRDLTVTERKAWMDAVNIAPVTENSSYYDDLIYSHMDLNPIIHFTGLFLPWHRLYVHQWTQPLRTECGYTGVAPYWAWEKYTANFENSTIWDTDPESGLGGFGDPDDDYTVKTGGLNITLAYPIAQASSAIPSVPGIRRFLKRVRQFDVSRAEVVMDHLVTKYW